MIVIIALWITIFGNASYFQKVLALYQIDSSSAGFVFSIVVLQFALAALLLGFCGIKYLLKPLLIVVVFSSAMSAYFMDSFGIVIDEDMLRNALQTNTDEALDLLSLKMIGYLLLLGVLPAAWIAMTPITWQRVSTEAFSRIKLLALCLGLFVLCIALFYKPYASFFREHKPVRLYSNPLYPLYSAVKYVSYQFKAGDTPLQQIGLDAHIPVDDIDRELIIVVVGETARWDHFSLNGYPRETNPRLKQEDIINIPRMQSCATSTALSLPCMFSLLRQDDFSPDEAEHMENALDVLAHAGVNILWRDNNSSSKGVAARVDYQDFKTPAHNPLCDSECRDMGMLSGLDEYIDGIAQGDILVVLHQMGNHGPAYFKRYPAEFDVFTPSCKTAQLEDCRNEEIINAYDNAILYTDFFLAETIQFLKRYADRFETGLLYVSDHGESLGEKGIYLHGLPNLIAPEEQTHVPAFLWLGESYHHVDREAMRKKALQPLSHDNLFHTLLGLFETDSEVHDAKLDLMVFDNTD